MEDEFPFEFEGKVVKHGVQDKYTYTVVFLPAKIRNSLPLKQNARLRLVGEIGEVPFEGACHPFRGRTFLMISRKMMKACGLSVGNTVCVRFAIADQDAVHVPIELTHAIEADENAERAWSRLTIGKRRSLAYYVSSAKRTPTRQRRVEEVLEIMAGFENENA